MEGEKEKDMWQRVAVDKDKNVQSGKKTNLKTRKYPVVVLLLLLCGCGWVCGGRFVVLF